MLDKTNAICRTKKISSVVSKPVSVNTENCLQKYTVSQIAQTPDVKMSPISECFRLPRLLSHCFLVMVSGRKNSLTDAQNRNGKGRKIKT